MINTEIYKNRIIIVLKIKLAIIIEPTGKQIKRKKEVEEDFYIRLT
jgi:hypothetical protein